MKTDFHSHLLKWNWQWKTEKKSKLMTVIKSLKINNDINGQRS